jgi:hypothetical protein
LSRSATVLTVWTLLVPSASSLALAEQGAATRVHQFAAFRPGRLAPQLHVAHQVSGSCPGPSLVVGRRSVLAWRCSIGNHIRDPCFSSSETSRSAVCLIRPWRTGVLLVRLTSRLPSETLLAHAERNPWGIWTSNGKRCVSYSGSAYGVMAGRSVTYGCDGGGILLGFANTRKGLWTIDYAPRYAGPGATRRQARISRVGITDVWR